MKIPLREKQMGEQSLPGREMLELRTRYKSLVWAQSESRTDTGTWSLDQRDRGQEPAHPPAPGQQRAYGILVSLVQVEYTSIAVIFNLTAGLTS